MWFSGAIGLSCHVVLATRSPNAMAKELFRRRVTDDGSIEHRDTSHAFIMYSLVNERWAWLRRGVKTVMPFPG